MIDNFIGRKCFVCSGSDLIVNYQAGDVLCRGCGEVVSDRFIDERNEILDYSSKEDSTQGTSRVSGLVPLISTQTEFVGGSDNLRKALKNAQSASTDKLEEVVTKNLSVIKEMCARLNLSVPIQDCARDLFSKSVIQRLVPSKDRVPLVASCVYLACRLIGYPRTIQEVSSATAVDFEQISKIQGIIHRGLKLSLGHAAVTPESIVNRYCSQLNLSNMSCMAAIEMCFKVTQCALLSDSPQKVAGGVILWVAILSRVELDVNQVSVVVQVSPTSLKTTFIKLYDSLVITVPSLLSTSFCGVEDGSVMSLLPPKGKVDKLLSGSKTVVLPALTRVHIVTPASSFSQCSELSIKSEVYVKSEIDDDFQFNMNYCTAVGRVEECVVHCYIRPKYKVLEHKVSYSVSNSGKIIVTTDRKKRKLSDEGVNIGFDGIVDIRSLVTCLGSIFEPVKRKRISIN